MKLRLPQVQICGIVYHAGRVHSGTLSVLATKLRLNQTKLFSLGVVSKGF